MLQSAHIHIILLKVSLLLAGIQTTYASSVDSILISEALCANVSWNYDRDFGAFSDWIELHNPTGTAIDIGGCFLSDDTLNIGKWEIPQASVVPPEGYVLFWADDRDLRPGEEAVREFTEKETIIVQDFHLNFKLNSDREELVFSDPEKQIIDQLLLFDQKPDYSYGRDSNNPSATGYFDEPSPMAVNTPIFSGTFSLSASPIFSSPGGVFNDVRIIALGSSNPEAVIRYTTDGSVPVRTSQVYEKPVSVNFSQVIKARVYEEGKLPGAIVTESYIINDHQTLPVLSVSTDHQGLWGFDFGIVQKSLKNREIAAHLEYFDETGKKGFALGAGLQLFGSQIFMMDQKPFSIFFRNRYGGSSLNYQVFRNKKLTSFSSLVLRNGGNDNPLTMFRDGLGASIAENQMDVDYQAYQPVAVYINGDYWGIYNLREKLNADYLQSNHKVNPDYTDMIEDSLQVNDGDANDYKELLGFLDTHDLNIAENYGYISEQIDINAYINYMSFKIYGAYKQWQVNTKVWRERSKENGWRWILFDLEHCFAGPGGGNYDHNSIRTAMESEAGEEEWPVFIFSKLMENDGFRAEFIQRSAIYLHTVFNSGRMTGIIDSLRNTIEPEMDLHITKWNSPPSRSAWLQNCAILSTFASERNAYMYKHMMDYFNIRDTSRISFHCSEGGRIVLGAGIIGGNETVSHTLFDGVPLHMKAIPDPGYTFSGWNSTDPNPELDFLFDADTSIFASFQKNNDIIIPDTIHGTLILGSQDQKHFSSGNIVILKGDSLIINEGVSVFMKAGASIINHGYLRIEAAPENPVLFDVIPVPAGTYLTSQTEKWGGICIQSDDTCAIRHLVIRNGSRGKDYFEATVSSIGSKVILHGLQIHDVQQAIYAYKSDVDIRFCDLSTNATGDLIHLRACMSPYIGANNLKGNYYEDTDAIDLDSVSGAVVEGNLIYSFFGSNSDGIDLGEHSAGISIYNNIITSCSDKGISVGQGSDVNIKHNVIVSCNQGVGIKDFNSVAYINQNTFYHNNYGIACFEKNIGKGGGTALSVNNIISRSREGAVFVDDLSSISISYSLSDTDSLDGLHNLFTNPHFVLPSKNIFRLKENSPCINSGDPTQVDPDGTRADIGAYITDDAQRVSTVLINEINFNAHDLFKCGDWIELYNSGEEQVDLSGWKLQGENPEDEYIFPDNTILLPGAYIVAARYLDALKNHYSGESIQVLGDFNFGLSRNGEMISLYDRDYLLQHAIVYNAEAPWPDGPDGKGATLELYENISDNSLAENWHSSYIGGGTPGAMNSQTTRLEGIFINEILAKNDKAFADPFGEYDDLIEVYNSNNFTIDLGGVNFKYESNGSHLFSMIPFFEPGRTTLDGGSFALFWADKDQEQGADHLDFSLRASGGHIGLVQFINQQEYSIDELEYGSQSPDIAFGRYPDGSAFLSDLNLTPASSNLLLKVPDVMEPNSQIFIYPNPADKYINIRCSEVTVEMHGEISNVHGTSNLQFTLLPDAITSLDISGFKPGIYFITLRGERLFTARLVIF